MHDLTAIETQEHFINFFFLFFESPHGAQDQLAASNNMLILEFVPFFFFLNPTRDVFKRATYSTICTLFSTIFPQSQIVFVLPDASYAVAGFSFFWGSLSSPTSARLHVTVITVELEMDRK